MPDALDAIIERAHARNAESDQDPQNDPLGDIIERAHSRNVQIEQDAFAGRVEDMRDNPGAHPNLASGIMGGMAQGAGELAAPLIRLFSGEAADELTTRSQALGQAQSEAVEEADMGKVRGWFNRHVPGASRSLTQAVALGATGGGMPAMAGGFAASVANSSYVEGKRKGMSEQEAAKYAAISGGIEAAIMSGFHGAAKATGISSLSGMEQVAEKFARGKVPQALAKDILTRFGAEITEEEITEVLQTINRASRVPGAEDAANWTGEDGTFWTSPMWDVMRDTLSQTSLMMGATEGSAVAARTLQRRGEEREERRFATEMAARFRRQRDKEAQRRRQREADTVSDEDPAGAAGEQELEEGVTDEGETRRPDEERDVLGRAEEGRMPERDVLGGQEGREQPFEGQVEGQERDEELLTEPDEGAADDPFAVAPEPEDGGRKAEDGGVAEDPAGPTNEELAIRVQQGDQDAVNQLLEKNQGLAKKYARDYARQPADMDALENTGLIAILDAAADFDPEKGTKFSTHAVNKMRGRIRDEAARMAPSGPQEGEETPTEGMIEDADQVEASEESRRMTEALGRLDEREELILRSINEIGTEKRTLQDIGDELGISKERVRQIARKAEGKLRDALTGSFKTDPTGPRKIGKKKPIEPSQPQEAVSDEDYLSRTPEQERRAKKAVDTIREEGGSALVPLQGPQETGEKYVQRLEEFAEELRPAKKIGRKKGVRKAKDIAAEKGLTPGQAGDMVRDLSGTGAVRPQKFSQPAYQLQDEQYGVVTEGAEAVDIDVADPEAVQGWQVPKDWQKGVDKAKSKLPGVIQKQTPKMGMARLPDVYRELPDDITVGQFHDALRELSREGVVNLQPYTGAPAEMEDSELALMSGQEKKYFASVTGKPAETAKSFPEDFEDAFDRLDEVQGGKNFIKLHDLRSALPQYDREAFNAGLNELRREGRFTLDSSDGNYIRLTPEEREAGIAEAGSNLVYASRREKKAPVERKEPKKKLGGKRDKQREQRRAEAMQQDAEQFQSLTQNPTTENVSRAKAIAQGAYDNTNKQEFQQFAKQAGVTVSGTKTEMKKQLDDFADRLGVTQQQERSVERSTTPKASTGDRILSAARKLSGGRGDTRVRLADLRLELGNLSRKEVDSELERLEREGELALFPIDDPQDLTPLDRKAALRPGKINARHVLYIEEGKKPAPKTEPEPKKKIGGKKVDEQKVKYADDRLTDATALTDEEIDQTFESINKELNKSEVLRLAAGRGHTSVRSKKDAILQLKMDVIEDKVRLPGSKSPRQYMLDAVKDAKAKGGRILVSEVADKSGLTPSQVYDEVKKLRSEGYKVVHDTIGSTSDYRGLGGTRIDELPTQPGGGQVAYLDVREGDLASLAGKGESGEGGYSLEDIRKKIQATPGEAAERVEFNAGLDADSWTPPETEEQRQDVARDISEELVYAWADYADQRADIEDIINAMPGLESYERQGETTEFDGRLHVSEQPVEPGEEVTVTEKGFRRETPTGKHTIRRARVEPVKSQKTRQLGGNLDESLNEVAKAAGQWQRYMPELFEDRAIDDKIREIGRIDTLIFDKLVNSGEGVKVGLHNEYLRRVYDIYTETEERVRENKEIRDEGDVQFADRDLENVKKRWDERAESLRQKMRRAVKGLRQLGKTQEADFYENYALPLIDSVESHLFGKSAGNLDKPTEPTLPTTIYGDETQIETPGEPISAQYAVVDLSNITPSHDFTTGQPRSNVRTGEYPKGLQPRDYTPNSEESEKVLRFAKEGKAQYYISDHPAADSGPPTISKEGVVINGNGRVGSLQAAMEGGKLPSWYTSTLEKKAEQFGIPKSELAKVQNPVLVRTVDMEATSPEAAQFARAGNVSSTQAQSPARTAASLSAIVDNDLLNSLKLDPDTTFSEAISHSTKGKRFRETLESSLPASVRSQFFDDNGALTDAGKELARNMLLSKIMPVETIEKAAAGRKQELRTIEGATPQLLKLKRDFPEGDVSDALSEAMDFLGRNPDVKTVGHADDALAQQSLFGGRREQLSPSGRMMVDFVLTEGRRPRRFRDKLSKMVKGLSEEQRQKKGLFSDQVTPTPPADMAAETLGVEKREGAFAERPTKKKGTTAATVPQQETAEQRRKRIVETPSGAKSLTVDNQALQEILTAQSSNVQQTLSTEARLPGEGKKPGISEADIVKTWERLFGFPLRVGNFSQRAAGVYKWLTRGRSDVAPSPDVARTAEEYAANLAVNAHEIAHHIDEQTGITQGLPKGLANEVAGLDYEPKARVWEGFAEYVRLYITEENQAQNMAPNFTEWFEGTWMPKNPKLADAIQQARRHARQFADQSVFQRIRSLFGKRPADDLEWSERWKRNSRHKLSRLKTQFIDKFHSIEEVQKEAFRRGYTGIGPYDLTMAYFMSAEPNAGMAMEEGVHSLHSGRAIGDRGLWKLEEHLQSDEEYNEAIGHAYAKHTLFMDEKSPGYNTGMRLQDARNWVAQMESEGKADRYDAFSADLAKFNDDLIRMLVDAGALSPEKAQRILDWYRDEDGTPRYFPLHRVQDSEAGFFKGTGSGFVNLPAPLQSRSQKGSGRQVVDPIDATVARAVYFYGRAIQARQAQTLAKALDPLLGGVGGMGGLMDRVPPGRRVTQGRIEEILDTLVEEGVIEADDARAMKVAAKLKDPSLGSPSKRNLQFFAERHGIELEGPVDQEEDFAHVAEQALVEAAETEPDAMATISLWRPDFTPSATKRTVVIHDEAGNPIMYEMDDELYRTVTGMDDIHFSGFVGVLREASRYFKSGAVGLSTGFGTANYLRDYWEFQGKAEHIEGLKSLGRPHQMLGRYVAYKTAQLRGKPIDDALVTLFEEAGGKIYSRIGHDVASRRRTRKRRLSQSKTSRLMVAAEHPGETAENALEAMQGFIAMSDAPPRLAEMEAAIRNEGYESRGARWYDHNTDTYVDKLPEAVRIKGILAAAESTVNFKRVGTVGRFAEGFIPFFNATLQAGYRQYRQMKNLRSIGQKTQEGRSAQRTLVFLSSLVAASMAYWFMRRDDDDWREQEPWLRDGYWTWGDNGKSYIRVPKPRDWAVAANLTENLLDAWYSPDDARNTTEVIERDLFQRVPTGGGLVRGGVETFVADYDYFRGRDLTPHYMDRKPKEQQFTPYTLEMSKKIGDTTGRYLNMSPIQVEHLLNSASGGLYRRLGSTWEAIERGDVGPEHVPFVRGVAINRHQARSVQDFYDELNVTDVKRQREEADKGRPTVNTQVKHDTLNDIGSLMTAIRNLERRKGVKGRRTWEHQPYIVGLARHALGRHSLEGNPNPFYENVPKKVREILADHAEGRAKVAVLGYRMPTKKHAEDESYEATMADWDSKRRAAEKFLKSHKKSPIVQETLDKIRASKKYRDLLFGRDEVTRRTLRDGSREDFSDYVRRYQRMKQKQEFAKKWLDQG